MASKIFPIRYKAGPKKIETYPEAASQSFKKGAVVYLVNGKVTIAAAAGANVGNISILGIAEHDASGTTDNPVKVLLATAQTEFVACLTSDDATATYAVTDIPTAYDLRHVTGAYGFTVNKNSTSNTRALPVSVITGTESDTFPEIVFKVPGANRQVGY